MNIQRFVVFFRLLLLLISNGRAAFFKKGNKCIHIFNESAVFSYSEILSNRIGLVYIILGITLKISAVSINNCFTAVFKNVVYKRISSRSFI